MVGRTWRTILSTGLMVCVVHGALFAAEPSNKARRYYRVLLERPRRGYVFDRFQQTWLETSSAEQLEAFLRDEADSEPVAGLLLAFLYETQAADAKAMKQYDALLRHRADAPRILYHKARLEATMLAYEAAIADLETAAAQEPSAELSVRIGKLLGEVQLRAGRRAEALRTWDALVAKHSEAGLREDIMDLLMQEGLFAQAIADCRELIEQTREAYKVAMLRLRLGRMYARSGRKAQAVETYRAALDEAGRDSWLEEETLSRLERLFRAEGDLAGLIEQYAKLRKDMPRRPALVRRHAAVLEEFGRPDEALKTFSELLALTPGDIALREQFVRMLIRAERYKRALAVAEVLRRQRPDDGEVLVLLADLHHRAGHDDHASEALSAYLEASGHSQYACLRAARLLAAYGLNQRAMAVYDTALRKHGRSAGVREARAQHLYAIGKEEEGVDALVAIASDGDRTKLLRVARQLGRRAEHAAALELLHKHEVAHGADMPYLAQLQVHADKLARHALALTYARRRVRAAQRPLALEQAVSDTLAAAQRAERLEAVERELAALEAPAVGQFCLLAAVRDRLGARSEADAALDQGLKSHPRSVLLWDTKYRLARSRRAWDEAGAALRRLMELQPARRGLHLQRLARIALDVDDGQEALRWVARWKRAASGAVAPYVEEARIYARTGNHAKAADALRSASRKFPDSNDILRRLVAACERAGRYEEASGACWTLLARATGTDARLGLVRRLAHLAQLRGSTERLVLHFETRLTVNPESVFPPLALAAIYDELGEYSRRSEYLLKATEIRPNDVALLHRIARVEEQEGQYDRAIVIMQRAVAADTTDESRRKLARLHLLYGDEKTGDRLLRRVAAGEGADPAVAASMAQALIATGRWRSAAELLSEALDVAPENYRLAYLRAVCFEESGQMDAAVDAFVEPLGIEQELPARRLTSQAGVLRRARMYAGLWPPVVMEFRELQYAGRQAYAYLKRQSALPLTGRLTSVSSVATPQSLKDLETLAMAHLVRLSQSLGDEQVTALSARLASRGVTYPELKLRAFVGGHCNPDVIEAYRRNHSDDWAVAVLAAWFRQGNRIESEALQEIWQVVRDSGHEQMAIASVLVVRVDDPGRNPTVREAVERLGGVNEPEAYLFYAIVQAMSAEPMQEAYGERLADVVVRLYAKARSSFAAAGAMRQEVLRAASDVLARLNRPERWVDILEAEVAAGASPRAGGPAAWHPMLRRRSRLFIRTPTFPPRFLPGIDSGVLYGSLRIRQFEMTDALKQRVASVADPVLRMLLTWAGGDSNAAEAALEELLEAPQRRCAARMLAGCWHAARGDMPQAVKHLSEARVLSEGYQTRRQIDAMIVGCGLADGNEQVTQAAKAAAGRLSNLRLSPKESEQLQSVVAALGMQDALGSRGKPTSAPAVPHHAPAPLARPAPTPSRDYIAKLMRAGKDDVAVRTLLRAYRLNFRNRHRRTRRYGGARDQLNGVMAQMRAHELGERVAAELAEGSRNDRLALGYLREALDQRDAAREIYRAVLTDDADCFAAHHRLALLTTGEQQQQHVAALDDRWLAFLGASITWQIEQAENIGAKLAWAELAVDVLARAREEKLALDASWARSILQTLEGTIQFKPGVPMTALFKPSYARHEAMKSMLRRRRVVYRRLCEEAAQTPQLKEWAFRRAVHLACWYGVLDARRDDLLALARRAIQASGRAPARHQVGAYHRPYGHTSVPYICPERYLVAHCHRAGETDALDTFVGTLNKSQHRHSRMLIEALDKLYDAEDEAYLKAAKTFMGFCRARRLNVDRTPLMMVIDAWVDGERNVSLAPLVLKHAHGHVPRGAYGGFPRSAVAHWGLALLERKGPVAVAAFIRQFDEKVLRAPRRTPAGRKTELGLLMRAVQQWTRAPDTAPPILAAATRCEGLLDRAQLGLRTNRKLRSGEVIGRLGSVVHRVAFLRHAPLLQDAESFRACWLRHEETSVLALTVARILQAGEGTGPAEWARCLSRRFSSSFPRRSRRQQGGYMPSYWISVDSPRPDERRRRRKPDDEPDSLVEWLRDRRPRTFGTGLVLVLVEDGAPEAVYGYLGRHIEAIRAMDKPRQEELCRTVDALMKRMGHKGTSDLAGPAGRYVELARIAMKDQLIETSRQLRQQRVQGSDEATAYLKRAASVIAALLSTDVSEAERLLRHVTGVARGLRVSHHSLLRRAMPEAARVEVLRLVALAARTPEAALWACRRLSRAEGKTLGLWVRLRPVGRCLLDQEIARQRGDVHRRTGRLASRVKTMLLALDALDEKLDGMRPPGFNEALWDRLLIYSDTELDVIEQTLAGRKNPSPLMGEALAAVRMVQANAAQWRPRECAEDEDDASDRAMARSMPEAVLAFHRAGLEGESLSLSWRLGRIIRPGWTVPVSRHGRYISYGSVESLLSYVHGGSHCSSRRAILPVDGKPRTDLWRSAMALAIDKIDKLSPYAVAQIGVLLTRMDVDASWKRLARPVLRALQRHSAEGTYRRHRGLTDTVPALELALALKVEDLDAAAAILAGNAKLAQDLNTYELLLDLAPREFFVVTFKKYWQQLPRGFTPPHHNRPPVVLSAELRAKADRWIAAMAPGDLRLLAEALFASLPMDCAAGARNRSYPHRKRPPVPEAWNAPPQAFELTDALREVQRRRMHRVRTKDWWEGRPAVQPRAAVVAAALDDLSFDSDAARRKCRQWYAVKPYLWTMPDLAPHRVEDLDLTTLLDAGAAGRRNIPDEAIEARGIRLCLLIRQGREEQAIAQFAKAGRMVGADEDNIHLFSRYGQLLQPVTDYLCNPLELPETFAWKRDPETWLTVVKAIAATVPRGKNGRLQQQRRALQGAAWGLYNVLGKRDEAKAWVATLSPRDAKPYTDIHKRYDSEQVIQPGVFAMALRSLPAERHAPVLERLEKLVAQTRLAERGYIGVAGLHCLAERHYACQLCALADAIEAHARRTVAQTEASIADGSASVETVCEYISWCRRQKKLDTALRLAKTYLRAHPQRDVYDRITRHMPGSHRDGELAMAMARNVGADEAPSYRASAVLRLAAARRYLKTTHRISNPDDAVETARRVVQGDHDLRYQRCAIQVLRTFGETAEALVACDSVLSGDAESDDVDEVRAEKCELLAEMDKPVEALREVPDSPRYLELKARLCEQAGRHEEAIEALLERDKRGSRSHIQLDAARNARAMSDHARAARLCLRAAQAIGSSSRHLDRWLDAKAAAVRDFLAAGEPNEAQRVIEKTAQVLRKRSSGGGSSSYKLSLMRFYLAYAEGDLFAADTFLRDVRDELEVQKVLRKLHGDLLARDFPERVGASRPMTAPADEMPQ
ncbi:MAG: tetratricopeptide repeat protein [Phycisphaerae bacterium]|nr:tetratricopeptide repeat protein [Phycisphaerae bacterium]